MSLEVTVICDGCGVIGDGARTGAIARKQLKENQKWTWHQKGARDFCPRCWELLPEARDE